MGDSSNDSALVCLSNIKVQYHGVEALNLDRRPVVIYKGEVVALLGPNGAGKSTLLKTIFGLTPVAEGAMSWQGQRVEKPTPGKMSHFGVSLVGQGQRVFPSMSVLENIELGGMDVPRALRKERVNEVLDIFSDLKQKTRQSAGELSGGQQQMVAIARELMRHPTLLLLDEPSLGLSPKMLKQVLRIIKTINRERKTTVVIVEHNIKSAMDIAHRVYVLDRAHIAYEGAPGKKARDVLANALMSKAALEE